MPDRIISLTVGTVGAEDWFKTFQQISEIATALDKADDFNYVSVSSSVVEDNPQPEGDPEGLYHDDETLTKVRRALVRVLELRRNNVPDQLITDLITEMSSEGILFRERR